MKKLLLTISLTLMVFTTSLLSSCSSGSSIITMQATGNPYEMFVVANKDVWKGAVGDSLRTIFADEVLWVNQPEPLFDLVNVTPQTMNDIMRRHRNIFIIKCNSAADTVAFDLKKDLWVKGQVVIDLSAPNVEMAANYIAQNGKTILDYLSIVERKRMDVKIMNHYNKKLTELIKTKFDFNMYVPMGYKVANDKIPNFLWMIYDMPISSQGISVYTFDKPKDSTKLDIIAERNIAVKQIPGPVDNSYMATDMTFAPESKAVEINNQAWIETRGFWRVEGDFMGGPFINYTTYDVKIGKYIGIDLYVYSPSPRYPKRNYIRQLEAIMDCVKL